MKQEFIKLFLNKYFLLKLLTLFIISFIYLYRCYHDFKTPYVTGDGFEYIFMTEALRNHGTPEIKLKDIERFKARFCRYHKWENFSKAPFVDMIIGDFKNSSRRFMDNTAGFYVNKRGHWYSYHFFFYSLLNLPGYMIGSKDGPVQTFYFTNAVLVIITCISLLFFTPFNVFKQILAAFCFCFSACYWYLGWQHTEIYASCFVTIALIFLFNKKHYWALFFLGIVCLQTQPLILLLGFVAFITLIERGFNVKNIVILTLLCSVGFIPQLFYLYHFNSANLIKDAGFLDTKFITTTRVSGFYFDFNQGIILAIPLILFVYIILIVNEIRKMILKLVPFDPSVFMPLCLIAISITVATMGNWNHGMAIINRYASWASCIIMVHSFYLTDKLHKIKSAILFSTFFATQIFTILIHQKFNFGDFTQNRHMPLAQWFLINYPKFYSPDPQIFALRTMPYTNFVPDNSPFIFFDHKKIKKMLISKERVDSLKSFGVSQAGIQKIKKELKFENGWGYTDGYFESSKTDEEIHDLIRERKILAAQYKILITPDWKKQIEQKAVAGNVSFEVALRNDAIWVVNLDEETQKEMTK